MAGDFDKPDDPQRQDQGHQPGRDFQAFPGRGEVGLCRLEGRAEGVQFGLFLLHGLGADRAGLKPTKQSRQGRVLLGDVIVAIDGERIRQGGDLSLALERRRAGETVTVTLVRDGKVLDVPVKLDAPR